MTDLRLRAARLAGTERCEIISEAEAIDAVCNPGALVWVDLVVEDVEAARRLLQDGMGFHELAVEDALSDSERPAMQEFDDHLFLSLSASMPGGSAERYVEIGFFVGAKALVTVAQEPLPVLDAWFERWRTRPGRLARSPAHLMHALIDAIVDGYLTVVDEIEDQVDDLGETLFEGQEVHLPKIIGLKRRLMRLRRAVTPARDVINALLRRDISVIPEETDRYFQDVFDHLMRTMEVLDSLREALTSMVDIHLSNVSNNLNQVLKKMTVLSTVLMTMALVSGVYGMNFRHIPELDWLYGYPFALGLMVTLAALILVVFKRVRWL